MRGSARRTPALVLRAFDFGETSQVLHLLTRDEGLLHGLAKGARRIGGAFGGGADVLTLGELTVYPRRPGADLRTLGGFRVATNFPGLRRRLARFHAASHVAALLLGFTREEEPAPELFELSTSALRLVERADDADAQAVALGFEAMLLRVAGFFPEVERCAHCGKPARNVRTTRLSALRGGLLCRACAAQDPRAVRVTGDVVHALRDLGAGPLAAATSLDRADALRRGLRDALDAWTSAILDRALRTSRLV